MIRQGIIALIFTFLASNSVSEETKCKEQGKLIFPRLNLTISIEIARTEQQRKFGLMSRKHLALNHGMFFIFERQKIQRVWMKKTLIPLDVIFVSEQGYVVSFFKNLQPCINSDCTIFYSAEKAKYMLEVNAGFIDRENIEIGEKVLRRCVY